MKIQILGSGGGEGYPALFCNCAHCKAARKAGGKSVRTLSQTLIDDNLLIDLPVDTPMHFRKLDYSLGDIENILITHVHADHYCPQLLETRGSDFAHDIKYKTLNFYGNSDVERLYDGFYKLFPIREEIAKGIAFHTVNPDDCFKVGGYSVTAVHAVHAPDQIALNYIIDDGKSVLLYLVDTGYPTDEMFEKIAKYPKKFDCVVMDATMGANYYVGHMNFAENIKLKGKLEEYGKTGSKTRFVVAHITHNHAGTHDEVEKRFDGTGIEPSYDGMIIEI